MPRLVKLLANALQRIQTQVLISREQLLQQQTPEALHDLRVSLRQLRSLLRPLRPYLDEAAALDTLVKKSMDPTTSIRDREVLIIELKKRQMLDLAQDYQQQLQPAYSRIAQQVELEAILQRLTTLPGYWQNALSSRAAKRLEQRIDQQWRRQSRKLLKLIQKKSPDKHRLRILIKQLRYNSETYQAILPKRARKQTQQLKKLQELLGTWHDYVVWLAHAQHEPQLHLLIPHWQQQQQYWEEKSDRALQKLRRPK